MKLSKSTIGIIAAVVIVALWASSAYNSMVGEQEKATTAFANVQSAYQRRADLIPNLVEVVKGYASHEKETLEGVVNARAKATQVTIDPSNMTPEKLKEYQQAQGELGAALGKLIAIQENYPDLKANENFRDLQVQLEGTENASTRPATRLMVSFRTTTPTSVSSPRTSLLASSVSTPWTSSRLTLVLRKLPK